MPKIDHFNLLGPLYDFIFRKKSGQTLLKLVDMEQGQKLLDVGGGTGRVTVLFEDISDALVVADSAIKMLIKAREKGLISVNAESEELPFQRGLFDRIIMIDALHHVADQKQTLREMWRLLAPGGKIVIEEPDINNIFVKLLALGEKLLLMRSNFLSANTIASIAEKFDHSDVHTFRKKGIAWITISKGKREQEKGKEHVRH